PDSLLLVEPELSGTNDPLCELQLVEVGTRSGNVRRGSLHEGDLFQGADRRSVLSSSRFRAPRTRLRMTAHSSCVLSGFRSTSLPSRLASPIATKFLTSSLSYSPPAQGSLNCLLESRSRKVASSRKEPRRRRRSTLWRVSVGSETRSSSSIRKPTAARL